MSELKIRAMAPNARDLAHIADRIAPGGRVLRTQRLPGGLSCRMDVLDVEHADGRRRKYTLRRFVALKPRSTPERVAREFEVLRLLERAGIAAPRPVRLDAHGEIFRVSAIVLSYVPGRPLFATKHTDAWARGLAEALLTVHAVTADRFDLSALEERGRDKAREQIDELRGASHDHPIIEEILPVLEATAGRVEFSPPTLIHDDYWPGNTVWQLGRLGAIVDWSSAKVGDPREDVAQCRVDLMFSHDLSVADEFRAHYERQRDEELRQLWFFDLLRGVPALIHCEGWLGGYHDLGLRHLTTADVSERLRQFLRDALSRARMEN